MASDDPDTSASTGGSTGGADADTIREAAGEANAAYREVRIDGDVVTRPSHPGSATVHDFLRHLRGAGVDGVPEPLGLDGDTETLRLIAGESGGDGWYHQHSLEGLRSAARLLGQVHDAGASWEPPAGAVLTMPAVAGANQVWCHGDVGPWNVVWRGDDAVGLIDWDFLHAAPRMDDFAHALRWFVPMRNDATTLAWHHFPEVPHRRTRIAAFLEAYGSFVGDDEDVVDAVVARIGRSVERLAALAERGEEPQRTWVADGYLDVERDEIRWIQEHRELLG